MRLRHSLAGIPPAILLCLAILVAWTSDVFAPRHEVFKLGMDVGRARTVLMSTMPVGTPTDAALVRLQGLGLSCTTSEPLLANMTWRVIECASAPSAVGATLQVDVAGRNGVVADIGVEDHSCLSRSDGTDPTPARLDCDMSSKRFLNIEAEKRAAGAALLAEVLGKPVSSPRLRQ